MGELAKALRFPEALRGKRVIWSYRHNAWWRADKHGYCVELMGAGLYSTDEADSICTDANRFGGRNERHFDAEAKWRSFVDGLSPRCLLASVLARPNETIAPSHNEGETHDG